MCAFLVFDIKFTWCIKVVLGTFVGVQVVRSLNVFYFVMVKTLHMRSTVLTNFLRV